VTANPCESSRSATPVPRIPKPIKPIFGFIC